MNVMRCIMMAFLISLFAACMPNISKEEPSLADKETRAELHYRLGLDAMHKGFWPKAFEELLLADKLHPKQPHTLDAIAYAWRVRGDHDKAAAYYKRAIDAGAGSAARNNYGNFLIELGLYKKAIYHLNIALKDPSYPNQALAFTNLGDAKLGLGNLEGSVEAYRKARLLAPNWSHPRLREAAAYLRFKQYQDALKIFEKVIRQEPDNKHALTNLIQLRERGTGILFLQKYIRTFINTTSNELNKNWAQGELIRLYK